MPLSGSGNALVDQFRSRVCRIVLTGQAQLLGKLFKHAANVVACCVGISTDGDAARPGSCTTPNRGTALIENDIAHDVASVDDRVAAAHASRRRADDGVVVTGAGPSRPTDKGRQAHAAAPTFEIERASPFELAEGVVEIHVARIAPDRMRYIDSIDTAGRARLDKAMCLRGEHTA